MAQTVSTGKLIALEYTLKLEDDQVVDTNFTREAARELTAAGFEVTLHISRNVAHGISPDGLDFATAFLLAQNA